MFNTLYTSSVQSPLAAMRASSQPEHHASGRNIQTHAGYVCDLPDLKREVNKLQWPINVDALRYRGEFADFLKARIWDRRRKKTT